MTPVPRPSAEEVKELNEYLEWFQSEYAKDSKINTVDQERIGLLASECRYLQEELENTQAASAVMREWLDILRRTLQQFPESIIVKDCLDKVGTLLELYPAGKILLRKLESSEMALGKVMTENRINLERAEKAESELAKTKQEFERFAERAALETCRKDHEITKLKAEILGLMEENERLDTNSGKTERGEKK